MSELGEAVGGAIEGGLYARAVEPKTGEGAQAAVGACLNCATELVGSHCHNCGQKARVHRTIGAFMHDLLHGALHFEGKIWHTLPLLALKPGQLTRRYIEGERARFVSPMALFLFSVFLMFAVFQAAGISAPDEISPSGTMEEAQAAADARVERARAELAGLAEDDAGRAAAEARLAQAEEEAQGLEVAQRYTIGPGTDFTIEKTDIAWLDRLSEKWRANPGLMLYKLQANSYKFSWLLIPLSIPFVWLLFAWRRRFKAYDHAIFVTYSLSFMTLFMITLALLGLAGLSAGWLFLAFTLLAPIHIYKQLRGTYELSRFSATWRLFVLLTFIFLILLLFLQGLVLVGLF